MKPRLSMNFREGASSTAHLPANTHQDPLLHLPASNLYSVPGRRARPGGADARAPGRVASVHERTAHMFTPQHKRCVSRAFVIFIGVLAAYDFIKIGMKSHSMKNGATYEIIFGMISS